MLGYATKKEVIETKKNYIKKLYNQGMREFEDGLTDFNDYFEALKNEAENALDNMETSIATGYYAIVECYNVFRANEWYLDYLNSLEGEAVTA